MKHWGRRLAALAVLGTLLLTLLGAGYPAPTSDFYVGDFAGVLSGETKRYIMEKSPALAQQTGAQIAVVTVASLDGKDPADYALGLAREWGIGDEEQDNGVLILLSPDEGEIRIEVGRGLEGAINDAKAGRMIDDYALDYYRSKDFDRGTYELYNAVLSQVMVEYGLDALPGYEPVEESGGMGSIIASLAVVLLIMVLLTLRGGGGGGGQYHRRGRYYGGFYGGGSSGGFGGGGGGFSGGGGGFGGGGAGRSF